MNRRINHSQCERSTQFFAITGREIKGIRFGTSIVPIYTRHPATLAQQALAINDVAQGRFRLGIGVSHRSIIEGQYGIRMSSPLNRLKEYSTLLRRLLGEGEEIFGHGNGIAESGFKGGIRPPILMAALGVGSYRLAGEISDGAISWMCPPEYLLREAIPALRDGATKASRNMPPVVAQMMVAMCDDAKMVRLATTKRILHYAERPFYANMFKKAGFDLSSGKSTVEELVDSLTIWGRKENVIEGILKLQEELGELLISPLPIVDEKKEFEELIGITKSLN